MPEVTIIRPFGSRPAEWSIAKMIIRQAVARGLHLQMGGEEDVNDVSLSTSMAEDDDFMPYQVEIRISITWPNFTPIGLNGAARYIASQIAPYMRDHDLTFCVAITPRAAVGFSDQDDAETSSAQVQSNYWGRGGNATSEPNSGNATNS